MNKLLKIEFLMIFMLICFLVFVSISSTVNLTENAITLSYSTYLGGNGEEGWAYIDFDNSNNCVLISTSGSSNFPMKNAIQSTNNGDRDIICLKLDTMGEEMLYSTYYGGSR
ncbi:MAG: hypothetical protein ACFFBD_15215, partial [Candidatus Hodarchaeota archaeon]